LPAERQTASVSFAAKGIAYGIRGVRCDGNDLFAVLKVTREAVARASRGEGPTLIEALTARMPVGAALSGTKESSDALISRSSWRKKDPLARVRIHLESRGLWSDAKQRDQEADALAEIDNAVEAAEALGPPALATMFDDVFATPTSWLDEQRAELLGAPRARGLAKP
jgi:pyruvate dehydrogenase E1 component alpha subunit